MIHFMTILRFMDTMLLMSINWKYLPSCSMVLLISYYKHFLDVNSTKSQGMCFKQYCLKLYVALNMHISSLKQLRKFIASYFLIRFMYFILEMKTFVCGKDSYVEFHIWITYTYYEVKQWLVDMCLLFLSNTFS